MKIAVCFSGQPRFLHEGFASIKDKILSLGDVDIYAHLWWDNSYQGQIIKLHCLDKYPNKDLGAEFAQLYKPKVLVTDPYVKYNYEGYDFASGEQSILLHAYHQRFFSESLIQSQKSAYNSIKKSLRMALDSSIKYDAYVRIRTDLEINGTISLEGLDLNKVNTDLPNIDFAQDQICDTIGIGNCRAMSYYANIYDKMDEISQMKVVKSTRYMSEGLKGCGVATNPWDVRVIRKYEQPKHMDTYTDNHPSEELPGWLKI